MKSLIAILCVLFMAGCSSVEMREPFPVSQLSEKERDQLEGTWKKDEAVFYVAFGSNGVTQLAWVERDKEDEAFKVESFPLHFAKRNKTLYVSFRMEGEDKGGGEPSGYFFMEVKPSDRQLIIWPPNADHFKQLVEGGTLKGSVNKNKHSTTVKLDAPAAEILELIATNPAAFNYREPTVFQKLD